MRQDFSKVIIERPRTKPDSAGSGHRVVQQRLERCDVLPSKAPMKPFPAYTRKDKSDLLGPLKRFLVTQALRGRKWDDIYCELSARWSRNGKTWPHLQHHAVDLVARNVRLVDGKPLPACHEKKTDFDDEVVWVHPDNGTLMLMPPQVTKKESPIKTLYISQKRRFVLMDGVWKFVKLTDLPLLKFGEKLSDPVTVDEKAVLDCILGRIEVGYGAVGRCQAEFVWGGSYYAVAIMGVGRNEQRQLQKRLGTPTKRRRERASGNRRGS